MKKLDAIEIMDFFDAPKEINEVINTCRAYPCKRHNSVHATMIFHKNMTLPEMHLAYYRFSELFFAETGLKRNKVSSWGYFFRFNKRSKLCPHIHQVWFSTKDAKTGKSVARLPLPLKDKLYDLWSKLAGEPMKMKRIYDYQGLIDYFIGPANLRLPKQEWLRLPSHNPELLASKRVMTA